MIMLILNCNGNIKLNKRGFKIYPGRTPLEYEKDRVLFSPILTEHVKLQWSGIGSGSIYYILEIKISSIYFYYDYDYDYEYHYYHETTTTTTTTTTSNNNNNDFITSTSTTWLFAY